MNDVDVSLPDPELATADGYEFELTGGNSALDFANSINRRALQEDSLERLTHYGRLVSWSLQAGLVSPREGGRLRAEARGRPRAAVAALRRAIALRESIFTLFLSIARGDSAPAAGLDALNAALPEALGALRVGPESDGFGWRFTHDETDLAPMLAPVLRAAAELLTSPDLVRVRECGSDACFWLFLDHSKNGTRRWCDMKVCGNRAKARRHYQREKAAARPRRRAPEARPRLKGKPE